MRAWPSGQCCPTSVDYRGAGLFKSVMNELCKDNLPSKKFCTFSV